jgi:hypothetical protein
VQLELESAQAAKSRLEIDNLALYSKVRYLQSYGASSSGPAFTSPKAMRISNRPVFYSASGRKSRDPQDMAREKERERDSQEERCEEEGEDVDLEGRYSSIYEERMNPFDQFSQREKQRKIQELTVTDRIILNTTMAVVSNQTGRKYVPPHSAPHTMTPYPAAHNTKPHHSTTQSKRISALSSPHPIFYPPSSLSLLLLPPPSPSFPPSFSSLSPPLLPLTVS